MKTQYIVYFIIITLFSGCGGVKSGVYKSICKLYHDTALTLVLNEDKTFEYKKPYVDEKVIGTWKQENNTLVLRSEYFSLQDKKEIDSIYKFTKAHNNDIYQIKGNKLLIYDENGEFTKKCLLKKIK